MNGVLSGSTSDSSSMEAILSGIGSALSVLKGMNSCVPIFFASY